ncbi:hypothetical protein PR202_ga15095 [Eleusine coracana subsp. coracana]|uniref:GDSL esterase/lipase n=1 Tax=Eleusine coracana subsp. coracana TaxID=191504 RepID=A0AAV5CII4_ELECO|nr:hypothetical protein PR202_ga15095 [Eleusine coracana subsp. coracana]
MGARRFAIMNVGLVGCVPVARLLSPTGSCSDGLNKLAAGFNEALSSLMLSLAKTKQLSELVYSLANSHGVAEDTFRDPVASDVASACCGGGRLDAEASCTPKSVLCTNRDQHVFFDQFHPSQRAAFLTVKAFYHDPNHHYTTPINSCSWHMPAPNNRKFADELENEIENHHDQDQGDNIAVQLEVQVAEKIDQGDDVADHVSGHTDDVHPSFQPDIFDPRMWDSLDSKVIDILLEKGPKRDLTIEKGSKDKICRSFSSKAYTRILENGEKFLILKQLKEYKG